MLIPSPMTTCDIYFRILTDAAPLKLPTPDRRPRELPRLPHPHGCGPIEAEKKRSIEQVPDADFRILTDAAPLKHSTLLASMVEADSLPHPHGCGPIEAAGRTFTGRTDHSLPHPHGCGPIEATIAAGLAAAINAELPHPHGCGPIEAIFVRSILQVKITTSASSRMRPH